MKMNDAQLRRFNETRCAPRKEIWEMLFVFLTALCCYAQTDPVSINSQPGIPIVEHHRDEVHVDFDIVITNNSKSRLSIAELQVTFYDTQNQMVNRRFLNNDAFAPSMAIIGDHTMDQVRRSTFSIRSISLPPMVPITSARYEFCLQLEDTPAQVERNRHRDPGDCDQQTSATVHFRDYVDKTILHLPLNGLVFIWEGHDFYSHHLRVPFGSPLVQKEGIIANSNEFADDFVYMDTDGNLYHGDATNLSNWYSYGKIIYAPATGTVIASANDIPENSFAAPHDARKPKLKVGKDPKGLGNFVLIDHRDGEYSLLLHMQPGSVRVKVGDTIKAGEPIGRIGFSGDAIFPHLHYSLLSGPEIFQSWGLPAYFHDFRLRLGSRTLNLDQDSVDSGEIVEDGFAQVDQR
jgi:hypothetical protein